jgi:hypothetical protein
MVVLAPSKQLEHHTARGRGQGGLLGHRDGGDELEHPVGVGGYIREYVLRSYV